MKNYYTKILSVLIAFICSSSINSCSLFECETIKKADLVIDSIFDTFLSTNKDGNGYNIAHTILNTIRNLKNCEEADKAGENTDNLQIYYSPKGDFSDQKLVLNQNTLVNSLEADEKAKIEQTANFVKDGYYKIQATADTKDAVSERNENNNSSGKDARGRETFDSKIILIEGIKHKPIFDKDGDEIYVKIISTTISYE